MPRFLAIENCTQQGVNSANRRIRRIVNALLGLQRGRYLPRIHKSCTTNEAVQRSHTTNEAVQRSACASTWQAEARVADWKRGFLQPRPETCAGITLTCASAWQAEARVAPNQQNMNIFPVQRWPNGFNQTEDQRF